MLPIKHNDIEPSDAGCLQFHEVEFLEDFGKIKKGKKFGLAAVDYYKGIVSCSNYDDDWNKLEEVEVKFKAVALD